MGSKPIAIGGQPPRWTARSCPANMMLSGSSPRPDSGILQQTSEDEATQEAGEFSAPLRLLSFIPAKKKPSPAPAGATVCRANFFPFARPKRASAGVEGAVAPAKGTPSARGRASQRRASRRRDHCGPCLHMRQRRTCDCNQLASYNNGWNRCPSGGHAADSSITVSQSSSPALTARSVRIKRVAWRRDNSASGLP